MVHCWEGNTVPLKAALSFKVQGFPGVWLDVIRGENANTYRYLLKGPCLQRMESGLTDWSSNPDEPRREGRS